MCTAITVQTNENENFFGRTMDFSYSIEPQLYDLPAGYTWQTMASEPAIRNSYRILGIGQQQDTILSFFDGVNEKGLAVAALYFAGYAQYSTKAPGQKQAVAAFDLVQYLLGSCASVAELGNRLSGIQIVGIPDPVTQTVAPLHWIATDKTGQCAVIEQTEQGLQLFHNPLGVLANSPDFPWHMTNLRNYMNVSSHQITERRWGPVKLTPFGQAGGTSSLPGGYTSPERFVRAAYTKAHIQVPGDSMQAVIAFFQVMESVSIPKGIVATERGVYDFTRYTACINTGTGEYFFKTNENPQITVAGMRPELTQPVSLGSINRPIQMERL